MILVHEERWADLVKELVGTAHLPTIEKYEQHLASDHAAEVADLYTTAIRSDLHQYTGRSHYQQAARYIRRMKKLGQHQKAEALVTELKARYPQRVALMEELQKI